MNRVFLVVVFALGAVTTNAQTFEEWFRQKKTQRKYLVQQIAALKVYLDYLKKGYKVVDKGLTIVGDIKQGKFDLDLNYLASLRSVNSSVRGSAKVIAIVACQRRMISDFRELKGMSESTGFLSSEEKGYVNNVYGNMLRESEMSLDELDRVLSNSDFEMKDDERMKRIDALYLDMKDKYAFIKSFSNSTRVLVAQRSAEKHEVFVGESLILK
ncbi:MAG: hypothetical protein DI539_31035 [Flavobacterium psychrophilum]|nr:MAG: hypothetical protein DI539_31035 [Flavobacterium psychrophilum]